MVTGPLISIIIPVHNGERYLKACLDSVLAQTYQNLEVLLIDDGSTDGSGQLCDACASRDERVRVIHLAENHGVSHARNVGIDSARGAMLSFVDADDEMENNMIECLYQNLMEKQADISVCSLNLVGFNAYTDTWQTGPPFVASGEEAVSLMISRKYFRWGIPGKLIIREVLKNCRFAERLHCGEDILFFYKLFGQTGRVSYIPEKLYSYIYGDSSVTHGGFSEKQYTESLVYAYLHKELSKRNRELLPIIEQKILNINVRLAVGVAECKKMGKRKKYAWLRRFRSNIRHYMNREALALFEYRKIAAEVILLYGSAELFWAVLVVYKALKRFLK